MWQTVDANGGSRDTLLAAVLASSARPDPAQAVQAVKAWWDAGKGYDEGTAAYGRRNL
jgi:hypothetical protein